MWIININFVEKLVAIVYNNCKLSKFFSVRRGEEMSIELEESKLLKDKYGNRKRGDNWEGRVTVLKQRISLYDIDCRRLEIRKKAIKDKCDELYNLYNQYIEMSKTVEYISLESYKKITDQVNGIYNEIQRILDCKKKTNFMELINKIYSDTNKILEKLKNNNPLLVEKKNEKTVSEWFYEWLWTYKHGHKAKTTFKGYVNKTKNHIIKKFGDRKLSDITTTEIQLFINDLMKDYKPATIKQIYLLLKEGYERAVKDKLINESPVIDIEIPTIVPNPMNSVEIEQEKKLISIFKDDEMCWPFAVLIDTGLRTSELCGLKWENIDFKNRRICVRQSFQRVDNYEYVDGEIRRIGSSLEETTLKSRTSKREVPMSTGVLNILIDIFTETTNKYGKVDNKNYVFINTKGNPVVGDCLRSRLDDLLRKNNMASVSLHRFRHTFATRLYEAKVQLKSIQALLGHSTVNMTERYLHLSAEDQTNSMEQLEEYYKKVGIAI